MIHIDWNQLETNSNNSKEIGFERFCFHYANILLDGYGQWQYDYNTAGSEFYLELQKPLDFGGRQYNPGDEIGWQAKFWKSNKDEENSSLIVGHRDELVEGLKNSLKRHAALKLWIICTPGQFAEDPYNKLKDALGAVSADVVIDHWHKAIFEKALIGNNRKSYEGLFAYYFCKHTIIKEQLDQQTKSRLELLKQKFDIDLHTASAFENQLMGIIDKKRAMKVIVQKLTDLRDRVERYDEQSNDERYEGLVEPLGGLVKAYSDCVIEIAKGLITLFSEADVDTIAAKGLNIIAQKDADFRKCAEAVVAAIKETKEEDLSRNRLDYYIEDILTIKHLLFGSRVDYDESVVYTLQLRSAQYFPVFAQAGYGKTHFACSLASAQLNVGHPVILMTGSQFRKCSRPQDVMLRLLGVEGMMTFDEMIGALDLLASFYTESRLPLIIDGLNESFPNEEVWLEELPTIVQAIEITKHLVLVTTCREKTEYIQKIYGKHSYEDVENASLLTGIEDFNLQDTIHKYFNKYQISETNLVEREMFKNPLLLKIFCEVNRGARGITVNVYSLTESMKRYSDNLVEKMSQKNGATDKMERYKVNQGLLQMGRLLWERNARTVDYYVDFHPQFGDKAEALIEEGLCFQIDIVNQDGCEVQFTYDLLAGYHIANYLLSVPKTAKDFTSMMCNENTYHLLFGDENEKHALSEDIILSLIYMTRVKYGQSLFELVTDDVAFAKILNGLDLICASEADKTALQVRLKDPLSQECKSKICQHVKDKLIDYHSVTGIAALLPAFLQMSREEMDKLFHSRFLHYGLIQEAVACVKRNLGEPLFEEDAMVGAVLLTGCFDHDQRQELMRILVEQGRRHSDTLMEAAPTLLAIDDPYIRESIYIVVHGTIVGLADCGLTETSVAIIANDLRSRPTSHVIILDCAESLFAYSQIVHGIDASDETLQLAKDAQWGKIDANEIWRSGVYNYDFEKYHLQPYCILGDDHLPEYTSDDLLHMVLWKMKAQGYDDAAYSALGSQFVDHLKYHQSAVAHISFKHVESAQRELVGWLLLNGKAKAKYKGTLRTAEVETDPSFPCLRPKRQLISRSYLPKNKEQKAAWLCENPIPTVKENLQRRLPTMEGEWVLLYGRMEQKSDEKTVDVFWIVESGLIHKGREKKAVGLPAKSHSHLFASEIGWRKMEVNSDDYYDPSLGIFLMQEYEFSRWNDSRASVSSFYFLTYEIMLDFGLTFTLEDLSYYRGNERVTAFFDDGYSCFFYIKRELLKEIVDRYQMAFVQELFAQKVDTNHVVVNHRWNDCKEWKEVVAYS